MHRKWFWLTDSGGEISYENHWLQVVQGARTAGVPVVLEFLHFVHLNVAGHKDFTLSSWYKASSGKSCICFEVSVHRTVHRKNSFLPTLSF